MFRGNATYKLKKGSFRENHKELNKNNKLILNSQQRFRSEKYKIFTEKVKKIALNANDGKKVQSIETHACKTNGEIIHEILKINRIKHKNGSL